MRILYLPVLCIIMLMTACGEENKPPGSGEAVKSTPLINYAVQATYPHDTTSFTEGLVVHNGQLYESTGATTGMASTRSLWGRVDLKTGFIEKKAELDKQKYFGEGIVFLENKVYQLTYQDKTGFIYDADSFKKLGEFTFPSKEGWGMTTDGSSLIMSDGTSRLTWLNPVSFKTEKSIDVTDQRGPLDSLNELEYINGFIYANVYTTNDIVKIDPATGLIIARLDLSSIVNEALSLYPGSLELNGIAYDALSKKIYVTGKMWPKIYEIVFPL